MASFEERTQRNIVYSVLFLFWFVFIICPIWFVLAALEVFYMKCRGFDWDRHKWGYVNRKTGERIGDQGL